jgi:hypothetical protein
MWNMKCFVIPVGIIIGATGIVNKFKKSGINTRKTLNRLSTKNAVHLKKSISDPVQFPGM